MVALTSNVLRDFEHGGAYARPTIDFPLLDLAREAADATRLAELDAIERELTRRRWLDDPCAWVEEKACGFLWSKQREILNCLRQRRRIAVPSCHGPGKSFTAGRAVAWWGDVHPIGSALAITTAPTEPQVRAILWKEIRRAHAQAKLSGRMNLKEWYVDDDDGVEELIALGRKPSEYSPTSFQGLHAREGLIIFDEAGGIPGTSLDSPHSLWIAAGSLMTSERWRWLAIGNPDYPDSEFAEICKPGSGWHVIWISVFDTPNFTGEAVPDEVRAELVGFTWVEERRQEWAPDWRWNADQTLVLPPKGMSFDDALAAAHPFWSSKVFGRFPIAVAAHTLIPPRWLERATAQNLPPSSPVVLGVDVGGGGDSSTIAVRRGPVVRIVHEDHNPDTMATCGHVVRALRHSHAERANVDVIGIGAGVVHRGKEQGLPFVGVCVGDAAEDSERFANRKAELWWHVRDRFEQGLIDLDPADTRLLAELTSVRYVPGSDGRIRIESKAAARTRGVASPNRADALLLAFADAAKAPAPKRGGVIW